METKKIKDYIFSIDYWLFDIEETVKPVDVAKKRGAGRYCFSVKLKDKHKNEIFDFIKEKTAYGNSDFVIMANIQGAHRMDQHHNNADLFLTIHSNNITYDFRGKYFVDENFQLNKDKLSYINTGQRLRDR